jgi:hypothetical protein
MSGKVGITSMKDRLIGWLKGFWAGIKTAIDGKSAVDSGSSDNTTQNR